ncbi:hypothetical protein OB905_05895 [Halobacteria archaeon AArc-dxtr1]|nr:hypothetical protein [Halobacteria archaeon AArc-dxtr1]
MVLIVGSEDSAEAPGESVVIEHEYDAETPASIAVVQAICALEDVDPVEMTRELGITLYEQIDPEALDAMLADGTGTGEVVISFALVNSETYRVQVADTGTVVVYRES